MPNRWPTVPLGNLVEIRYGKAFHAEDRPADGKFPVYGSNGIVGTCYEPLVSEPTIVIGRKGAIGEAHLAEHGCWPIDTAFYTVTKDVNRVNLRYLHKWLAAVDLKRLAITSTIPGINRDVLAAQPVKLPPLTEQERIVGLLDEADALRQRRAQADRRTADFIPALFHEMFGDPGKNPKRWPVVAFPDLCDGKYGVKAGPFGSSLKKECYTTSGYRVYGQEQVIAGDFTIGDYYISKEKFEALRACEVKAGDVLISLVGTFGKVVVVPDGIEPGIINPRLLKISPKKKKVDSVFLATLLQQASVQSLLLQMSHGGTMGILNAGLLKQLRVPLPPVRLQREFAERVAEVRALETAQAQSRQRLEALFASLLDRAFQGEL